MTTISPLLFYNFRTFCPYTIDKISSFIYNGIKLETDKLANN